MKIKAIIFDLDGTLLDSMHCWENVDKNFLLENGVEPPEGVSDIVKKMTIQDSANYFKTQFSLPQSCEEIIDRIEEMVREQYERIIPLKNGAGELVEKLEAEGIKMCVASATYNSLADAALNRLGIDKSLEFILTCSDVGVGKDKPDIFNIAAEKMGGSTADTIVVEDSLHCIETAARAGFKTIAVYDDIARKEWDDICCVSWKNVRNLTDIFEIVRKENENG